ncbi:TetR/AcrR family transcriptional regulator [Tsukamurella sp. 8F]|uniref:TetR/AcrR family transcriptional regulator n=1 Tax=unclassified Tsukamurella TaxID=2633480 RepID=UPI0023B9056C|nr:MULTISPECIES: TetR/AcrR family transcriptional regulator [unclassified Tsukamurella]MDF0531273.1 TetR/AcrR family transcriptional regulator [Tsukamurella sp. 8J]MDF0585222.1 TetR/AcrR family transcriptional regulator [Tsukamurella sp. 8F]
MPEPEDFSRAAQTRARLLDAAVTAFAERGFHGTSTRDIASAAGMSPAAVYVHHRSKEELLYQISSTGHAMIAEVVRNALASTDDPVDQLRAVVRDFVAHHARRHTSARVVNYELASLGPEHREEILAERREIDAAVRGVIERGAAAGAFDVTSARMAAVAVLSLGIDAARWYREDGDWSPEEIGDFYADLVLRMVAATPSTDHADGSSADSRRSAK